MSTETKPKKQRMSCKNMQITLRNERNSCYLDAMLVALFHSSSTKDKVLQVILGDGVQRHRNKRTRTLNRELIALGNNISAEIHRISSELVSKDEKSATCSNLRRMIQQYHDTYIAKISPNIERINWVSDQLEPLDVLSILQTVFKTHDIMTIEKTTMATKSLAKVVPKSRWEVLEQETRMVSHIDMISLEDLQTAQDENGFVKLRKFYPRSTRDIPVTNAQEQDGYTRRVHQITIQDTPVLFVFVSRLMGDIKMTTPVMPLQEITTKDGNTMRLSSIIVHHGTGSGGGHYTCCYKCGNTFYEHDDLMKKVRPIGSMADVKEYRNGYILKNAVLFLYA